MDVALFAKCVEFIDKKYSVCLLEDAVLSKLPNASRKDYASIVFDDGYKDNIDYALPILDKFRIKASFYVVTDCINRNIPTWTYILDYLFQYTKALQLNLDFCFLPEHIRVCMLRSKQHRINCAKKLKPFLKKLTHDERQQVLSAVQTAFTDVEIPQIMMDWKDVSQLSAAGHKIGSHTVTHSLLGTIRNEEQIRWELQHSAITIKEKLGFFPEAISYPVGSYNATVMQLSADVGYKVGLAVNQTDYLPPLHGPFEVPRIELYNEPWLKTRCRMNKTYQSIVKLFKR
jgi:peptidoglycan/xylan/chitin deacetylase (PgdA/CDA1 family)